MKGLFSIAAAAVVITITQLCPTVAWAQDTAESPWQVSVLGGVNAFIQNDTSIPDNLFGIPVAATATYRLTPNLAAEGEVGWFIPVKAEVEIPSGTHQAKAPDALSYQVGLRGTLPRASWSPYLAAGCGALTLLSETGADRVPQLGEPLTVFAVNFGGGAQLPLSQRWGVRGDIREFVGFPPVDAAGLAANGDAGEIWLSRATVGVDYKF